MKTKIFIIAVLCLIGYAFAQNQLPATAPDEQTKDKLIVELTVEKKMLTDHLRRLQMTPPPLPQAGLPDFLVFQNKGDGMWKMWSRDGHQFTVSGTNVLITPK